LYLQGFLFIDIFSKQMARALLIHSTTTNAAKSKIGVVIKGFELKEKLL